MWTALHPPVQVLATAFSIHDKPSAVARYRSGPTNAKAWIGRPLGDVPTDWTICGKLGSKASTCGFVTRTTLPLFWKPTYRLPSGPRAMDVGWGPPRPPFGAIGPIQLTCPDRGSIKSRCTPGKVTEPG